MKYYRQEWKAGVKKNLDTDAPGWAYHAKSDPKRGIPCLKCEDIYWRHTIELQKPTYSNHHKDVYRVNSCKSADPEIPQTRSINMLKLIKVVICQYEARQHKKERDTAVS